MPDWRFRYPVDFGTPALEVAIWFIHLLVRLEIIRIRRIFEAAYQNGLILSNPAERLLYVKRQKKQTDPLTLDEVELVLYHIFEHFPPTIYSYFELALFTGLRTSEQIVLRWDNVDFKRSILNIQRSKVLQEVN